MRVLPGNTLLRHLLIAAAGGAALWALTYQLELYRDYQLATAAAYLCATAGLTVLTGLNGQLSLGHGALMAVGAYTVALSQDKWGILSLSLALGVLAALAAGLVIGLAAARLRGPYLAGVTLAVAVAVPAVTTTWSSVFNSDQGLPVALDPPPGTLALEQWQAWLAVGCALGVLVLLANLTRSRFGRDFRAVRDDETAARLAGIDVARTQVLAFVVSAAGAGLGGGLLAVLTQSVSPGAYALSLSLYLLMAVVVGGLGSLAGAVWGALLLVFLPDLTHQLTVGLALSPGAAQRVEGNLPLAVFGLTLVIVMIAAPGGLQGLLRKLVPFRTITPLPKSEERPVSDAQRT
ncbi:branched-chain amino acid ABC transporter permease [Hamadaea tsunoensis]|uniref:branched-chain amino acid ABC transporter permease n=1 Tax=Hamadaea tsunoensis TaxID=53368 RepID=UPI0009FD22F6|nr:branched-chain amino acid ABC transporter permease [Hamadaea tsunoensis]